MLTDSDDTHPSHLHFAKQGTNASLMVKDERESFYRGQRFVLFDGRVTNSGRFPLVNVGLDIENITQVRPCCLLYSFRSNLRTHEHT